MAVYPIRVFGDPVIKEKSLEVMTLDGELNKLAKSMAETMYDAHGVGLAAPQIGILKRMIVVDLDKDDFVAYVNPKIIDISTEEEIDDEGCLCVPDVRVPVKRAIKVVVRAVDLKGREIEIEAEDMLARILQHEIDHLEGRTIMDRTDKEARRRAIREFMERNPGP